MKTFSLLLGGLLDISLMALALMAIFGWRKGLQPTTKYLGLAIGSLGIVATFVFVGQFVSLGNLLSDLVIVAFMGSAYFLLLFRDQLIPLSRKWLFIAFFVLFSAGILIAGLQWSSRFLGPYKVVIGFYFILSWSVVTGEPAIRFWLTSRKVPAVQKARLKALSLGYLSIILVLLFSGFIPSATNLLVRIVIQVFSLAIIPFLYISFAPPRWLKYIWRAKEEGYLTEAMKGFLSSSSDLKELLEAVLTGGIRWLGADSGLILNNQGEVLISINLETRRLNEIVRIISVISGIGNKGVRLPLTASTSLILEPLFFGEDRGRMVIVSGPFTPVFGEDEAERLSQFALLASTALERLASKIKLAESEEHLRRVIDQAITAIVGMDQEGLVTIWNIAAEKLFGWTEKEAVGQRVADLIIPQQYRFAHEEGLKKYRETGVGKLIGHAFEIDAIDKAGETIQIELYIAEAWRVEGEIVFVAFVRNITALKKAETELKLLNEELEERVALRTQELRHSNSELRSVNEELESFSYSVSHDLRAPLRAIDAFAKIVQEENEEKLDADAKEYLELIRKNSINMGTLVDDLLSFSKMGRNPLERTSVKTKILAEEVLEQVKVAENVQDIEFVVGELDDSEADGNLLKQVLVNLISNAIKFSRNAHPAIIEIGCLSRLTTLSESTYFVRDNGIGIDMKYADKVFGVFEKLHKPEEYEGTGVGLAIVERIIIRHGGRIWLESTLGKGTTFFFTLGGEANE
jgi:PAS domain S-box-containing protein